jgi:hypothetical protein
MAAAEAIAFVLLMAASTAGSIGAVVLRYRALRARGYRPLAQMAEESVSKLR